MLAFVLLLFFRNGQKKTGSHGNVQQSRPRIDQSGGFTGDATPSKNDM